ncbi:helix-turn-helix domain-containing protein [Streptomyces sp. NPDC006207]
MSASPSARAWNKRGDQRTVSPVFRPPKLSPQQRDEIVQRLRDGDDPNNLALEFDVSVRTIRHYM